MINEANVPSSACRSWRIPQVETSTPPRKQRLDYRRKSAKVNGLETVENRSMRRKCEWLLLCSLLALTGGCSGFAARRIAQAPNTYPSWLAPEAPVVLDFSAKLLTNSPKEYVEVGPPQARLCYRIVQPGD